MSYRPDYQWLQPYYDEIVNHHKHHALLLTGEKGVGKEALATALAFQWLDNDGQDQQSLIAGSHPDLHVLAVAKSDHVVDGLLLPYAERFWDKKLTVISTDMVREVSEKIMQSPMMGEMKVVIILNADRMSIAAANTILKVLEEPPVDTRFIVTTCHSDNLSATVKSRCISYGINSPHAGETHTDWRALSDNAPLMEDFMRQNQFDDTYALIEKVMPYALTRPSTISDASRLLSERIKHGLWSCLFAWIYHYQLSNRHDSEKSRQISDFYNDFLRLSNDAQRAAIDTRSQLYALLSRHSPLGKE